MSKLILGVMQYGSGQDWMISDHDEGIKQMKYAYDKGINVSPLPPAFMIIHLNCLWGKNLTKMLDI